MSTHLPPAAALNQLRRASGCLGTSHSSSHECLGTSRGSSSTTSPTPRVRVPRHIVRLVVDYFAYAVHPSASARRAARRAARRRLLRLRHASGCLSTSRGPSSTTSPTPHVQVLRHVARLVVDYFAYDARPGASTCRTASRAARRRLLHLRRASGCLSMSRGSSRGSSSTTLPHAARRRLLRLRHVTRCLNTSRNSSRGSSLTTSPCAARRRPLRLRRATGCLGTSRGSSRGSSSTTSTTPRVRVPRHVARLVVPLIVDYFAYAARPGASARPADRHAAHRRLLHVLRLCLAATLALFQPRHALRLLVSLQHRLYFEYAARHRDVVFRSHRVDHSSRLVFETS
jgi:hypothetical protein